MSKNKTTSLEDVKIEDASYGLKSTFRLLTWLEQNGWRVCQESHNDIIGHGCGIYQNPVVNYSISFQKQNDKKFYNISNQSKVEPTNVTFD